MSVIFPEHFPDLQPSSNYDLLLNLRFFFKDHSDFIGEGNGTLLQYSCLENPMDGGAW